MDFLKGRTNRATYWSTIGIVAGLMVLFAVVLNWTPRIYEVVLAIICIPRLHDVGRSGWWFLAILGPELAAMLLAFAMPLEELRVAFAVATLLILGLVALLGAIPGQPGGNRFGAQPRPGVQWGRPPRTEPDRDAPRP